MGKSCSKHQGFELFADNVSYRTAPEGKPADEGAVELPTSCCLKTTDECQTLQEKTHSDRGKGCKFVSDCNLIVELPAESDDAQKRPPNPSVESHSVKKQSQATQTPTVRRIVKPENRNWSYTYYDFEDEKFHLPENDVDDSKQALPSVNQKPGLNIRGKECRQRRHSSRRSSRQIKDDVLCKEKLNNCNLLTNHARERLALASLDRELQPSAVCSSDAIESRVPRRNRRSSVVGGNAPATTLSHDGLPVRTETYPGSCAPSSPVEDNDVSSLLVERGSEFITLDSKSPYHNDNHSIRCPCMRKRNCRKREKNCNYTQQYSEYEFCHDYNKSGTRGATNESRDRHCYHGHRLGHRRTSKIDRSCLCADKGTEQRFGCDSTPREIVLRHEHHHFHHFPKARSSGRRRTGK